MSRGCSRASVLLPVMSQNLVAHRAACSGEVSRASIFFPRLSGSVSARKAADRVDRDPAQKLSVAAQVGRYDVEAAKFGEDFPVDIVDLGQLRIMEPGGRGHGHQDADRQHVAAIGYDDRSVAGPQSLN